ncbi:hypothetical protein AB0436_19900 [Streptomyces sp. NPDC051322]|uniref:hypothetical protein n=1 Tax=Streptomyces sp. NPDC051322 TaxID=3154645 RepID=UPI00344FD3D8
MRTRPSDRQGPTRFTRSDVCSRACATRDLRQACAPGRPGHAPSLAEAEAITATIGTESVVTATKTMTGHLPGAPGALGAMAAILALWDGVAPMNRNVQRVDERAALDVVTGEARTGRWEAAPANSFGSGRHDVSLVVTTEGCNEPRTSAVNTFECWFCLPNG